MKDIKQSILYEDEDIIVCHKNPGIAVQTSKMGEQDMESLLKNYLRTPYLGIIHRLDQPVEGLLVFAKNKQAAAGLSRQNAGSAMSKQYYAAVFIKDAEAVSTKTAHAGAVGERASRVAGEHTLVDYLIKNGRENTSRVAGEKEKNSKDARRAELSYEIIKVREDKTALVRISLKTGRHHQIRVQMAHAGMPLLGDGKYGDTDSQTISAVKHIRNVALCAYSLTFSHPRTGKRMRYEIEPSGEAFSVFFQ